MAGLDKFSSKTLMCWVCKRKQEVICDRFNAFSYKLPHSLLQRIRVQRRKDYTSYINGLDYATDLAAGRERNRSVYGFKGISLSKYWTSVEVKS